MSSQKGSTKRQLSVTHRAIILHFYRRAPDLFPFTFSNKVFLRNNPEINKGNICFYEKQSGTNEHLNAIYEQYGIDTFESEQLQWLDNDGSLICLGDIPIHIFKKYELGQRRIRLHTSHLGEG